MTDNEKCAATCKDGSPCEAYPVTGEEKCRMHLGKNGSSHDGNDNAETHGAFKEHFRSDLTPEEAKAIDSLVDHLEDVTGPRAIAAESAAEALMKYKRSADSRFLREARQWFGDFNLIPNGDELELGGQGGGALEVALNREVVDNDGD